MNTLKKIRQQLGISQVMMSGYLGVGNRQISQVEKGLRKLSKQPLLKLTCLHNCIQQATAALPHSTAQEQAIASMYLLKQMLTQQESIKADLLWTEMIIAMLEHKNK